MTRTSEISTLPSYSVVESGSRLSSDIIRPGFVRVSTVLGYYSDYSKVPPDILARKCKIGTEVHEAIESFYNKELFPLSYDAELYYQSFKDSLQKELGSYTPRLLEERLYSKKLGITGQIDMLATKEDRDYLIDFKTSYSANIPVWSLQTALYALLLAENQVSEVQGIKVLHLGKRGKYSFLDIPVTKKLYSLAKATVDLYWHFNKRQM